jgi:DNA-binding NarL/FixJ family response regulator
VIRVVLVDDQQLIRAGLKMLCAEAKDIEVVGEAGHGQHAITVVERVRPDVVLMDLRMPGIDGIEATGRILADRPATRVVALTTFDDDEHLYPALRAGACGFLAKDTAPDALLDGIRRAAAGDGPFSPHLLQRVVTRALGATPAPGTPASTTLTERERDVLTLLAEGRSNAEIAQRLFIGVNTVKTHVGNLMAKTDSHNRVQLALTAARLGITPAQQRGVGGRSC